MYQRIFKYLTLVSLLLVLDGCYTLLYDPLRVKPAPKINVRDLENNYQRDERDEHRPMVNRRYELHESIHRQQWLQRPYLHRYDGYYHVDPYYYNSYNAHSTHHIHDIQQSLVSQIPAQQNIKVEVKETPTSRDVEKARMVWERRINPSRVREIPTPIRRQKDGE